MQTEQEFVTFILVNRNPTSYQKADMSFFEFPIKKRILPTYSVIIGGEVVKCRHIRNSNSIIVDKQKEQGDDFVALRDNIYFHHGICVLHKIKNAITIEFLRKSPENISYDNKLRSADVEIEYKEVEAEKTGLDNLNALRLESQAMELVWNLQYKNKDESFSYNEDKLMFFLHKFKVPGNLEKSQVLEYLLSLAKNNPEKFIYDFNNYWGDMESLVKDAFVNEVLLPSPKAVHIASTRKEMFNSEKAMNDDEIVEKTICHLVLPENDYIIDLIKIDLDKKKE